LLPTFAVVFYIWYLVGTAEIVGTSGWVARRGLSWATQLVAEVQLGLYPERSWLDAASRAVCSGRAIVSCFDCVLKQGA